MLGKGNEKIIDSLRNQTRTKATIIFGDPIPEAGPRIHATLVCVILNGRKHAHLESL